MFRNGTHFCHKCEMYGERCDSVWSYTVGRKYARIIRSETNGTDSAWAFVDVKGNLYKVASWKSPAKGIRGHIDPVLDGTEKPRRPGL